MAIDVELAGLKAAGTYRFEKDLSTLPGNNATESYSNLRLIVGFSKKGPFNSVQLITSATQFTKLYGNIDRSLEKKGSYFHRSALAALSAGPILCLNLLSLDLNKDQVMHRSISTNIIKSNKNICTIPYQTVYDTDKFWVLSPDSYLDAGVKIFDDGSSNTEMNNVLNFTNVGNKPISVIVKKASAKNTKGYDVTLNEWYGEDNVPEYLNGTSFVSDYMVEVYVVAGDFGPKLEEETKTKVVSSGDVTDEYDFDITNTSVFVDECYGYKDGSSDDECVYTDETGKINPYKRFSSDITYQEYFDKYGFIANKLNKFLSLPSVNVIATYTGSLLPNFTNKLNQNMWIQDIINNDTLSTGLLCTEDVDLIESAVMDSENGFVNEAIDIVGHNFHCRRNTESDYTLNFLSYGLSQDVLNKLLDFDDYEGSENVSSPYINKIGICDKGGYNNSAYYIDNKGTAPGTPGAAPTLNVDADNEIIIDMSDFIGENKKIQIGDMLLSCEDGKDENENNFSRLTRVVEIKYLYRWDEGKQKYDKDLYHVRVICSDRIYTESAGNSFKHCEYSTEECKVVYKYSEIDSICDRYHWTFLKGFKVSESSMPDGTNERQNEILNMISEHNENSNLYKALIDRDYVQWRYLVDTFGYGIESECKKVYGLLCKGRQSGLALVNAPSMKDFKKETKLASFIDKFGAVKTEYIACGGHSDGSALGAFTLPKEENGASWSAYFYPYLKISDLASIKTVPPAAYVSNLYISKYTSAKPWSIVAGPKRGVIAGNQVIGTECSLIQNDREYLEPMGINPIIWESGVGIEVFANKTAKQTPVSALSSIHAREACIYIQDNVESILKKYNWESNTARNREEIKTLVDTFLSNMKQGEGLYDFKTVMDTTNNTSEIIDRNMGVIDIYVEVVRGLEILAQRLTVLKTGSIESGDFE